MDNCIRWNGYITKAGYGITHFDGKIINAHRAVYLKEYGPIPKGFDVDHICKNRTCVNLEHLRLLTHKENVLLGNNPISDNAKKTKCVHGHLLEGKNLYVKSEWSETMQNMQEGSLS